MAYTVDKTTLFYAYPGAKHDEKQINKQHRRNDVVLAFNTKAITMQISKSQRRYKKKKSWMINLCEYLFAPN